MRVALLVKELLDALGVEGYPKTSGAAGMHVLAPSARRHTYEATRSFVALARVERHGDLFAPVLAGRQSLARALSALG